MAETNIYEQLRKVQVELKVPKNQRNSFGNYNYRSAEDIIEAAKPVLDKHGLLLVISDELVNIGDRYYIKATATVDDGSFNDVHSVSVDGYAREDETKKGMDGAQITGAASSYARKYALNGLLAIDDTKDADSDEHRSQGPSMRPAAPKPAVGTADALATGIQKRQIKSFLTAAGVADEDMAGVLKDDYGVADSKSMTKVEAIRVLQELA